MGIFDGFKSQPKPSKRTKKPRAVVTPSVREERRKAIDWKREQQFLTDLQKNDPLAYSDLMKKRLGIATPQDAPSDRLTSFLETAEALRVGGILKNPEDLSDDKAWMKDLAKAVGPVIGGMFGQPPATSQHPPQVSQPQLEQGGNNRMSLISQFAINQLQGKSPEAAAQWLITLPYAQSQELVAILKRTPDVQIMSVLDTLAVNYPDFAGLVVWLHQRPEWMIAVVQAIRVQSSVEAKPVGGQMGL